MIFDRNKVLAQIMAQLEVTCAVKTSDLLLEPSSRLVDGAPTKEELKVLLPTLRARLENSRRTGKKIYGLEQLISTLGARDSSDITLGYGFISAKAAGNIYLSAKDEQLLGVAIVDREAEIDAKQS